MPISKQSDFPSISPSKNFQVPIDKDKFDYPVFDAISNNMDGSVSIVLLLFTIRLVNKEKNEAIARHSLSGTKFFLSAEQVMVYLP